ncbi:MAG: methyltransferase domain-containing protein [Gemmatimonadota bacterium]|nr:methyltransferase domain-containing protein [Gemmatimonadota bacterium]
MLDLIRLSPRRLFPPGGLELYRQIALLTRMSEEAEVLDAACGKGVSLEYFVREFGVHGSGVDPDRTLVEQAEQRTRALGIADRLQFQEGRADALPYRDEIFDVSVGEVGLAGQCDPRDAVRELVRVTKPGGFVVLVQLVWKAPVDAERQRVLAEHLGARPRMVVEWKRFLRSAGVEDLHTEDWSDARTSFRATVAKPFPDFVELFSIGEKIGIMRRAWAQWGWKGVWTAFSRERAVHRLLTRERILGLDLLRGRRSVPADRACESDSEVGEGTAANDGRTEVDAASPATESGKPRENASATIETRDLPLFGDGQDEEDEDG